MFLCVKQLSSFQSVVLFQLESSKNNFLLNYSVSLGLGQYQYYDEDDQVGRKALELEISKNTRIPTDPRFQWGIDPYNNNNNNKFIDLHS